ncbi:type II toxin-antitoxin system VapC family toxin [Salinadaptatus halalkaliphilus]|uniref:Ribonuclease VapC n=1 Tax=Salinadaptatus halalkaliphilus TaxID=2419781 RepID=A0A4S3TGE3_9EURY|nr:type II toxin-antitoxin system VapC family toxin [Salinadaptatus halalkaliphilus]THE62951.1 type II toxin-antitoxin system VapC family toxin [Salinadaptatus halalkaliphilus]
MIVLDTTFLVDYLEEEPATAAFLEAHRNKPFFATTLTLFEAYRGGARTAGRDGVDRVADALDWIEPLEQTESIAREAAVIEAELLEAGAPINLGDILIAATCRHNGARLVTRDGDFERVEGVETVGY